MGNPVGQANIQALHQRRMMEQQQALAAQQYARERQDKRDDFTFEQDYRAQHPGPVNNDTVNDYNFILQTLGPDKAKEYLETKANPPQFMQVPGVGIVQIPRAPGGSTPTAPVGKLTPLTGDAGGNASGGFPY
jgi:hypothetical protein